MSDSTLAEVD